MVADFAYWRKDATIIHLVQTYKISKEIKICLTIPFQETLWQLKQAENYTYCNWEVSRLVLLSKPLNNLWISVTILELYLNDNELCLQ